MAPSPAAAVDPLLRERVQRSILRRLFAGPDSPFVVRGGILMRGLVGDAARPAIDLDLLSTAPFDEPAHAALLHAALAGPDDDAIAVAPEAIRHERTWADTPSPGLRVMVDVAVDDATVTQQIDVGYDDPIVSPARPTEIAWRSRPPIAVPAADAIQMFAWKFHELVEKYQWNFKHLYDLHLLQRLSALQSPVLVDAVRLAFTSRGTPLDAALRLLAGRLGLNKRRAAGWRAFRRKHAALPVPDDHMRLLNELADFVRPLFAVLLEEDGPAR